MKKIFFVCVIAEKNSEEEIAVPADYVLANDAFSALAVASKRIKDKYFDEKWDLRPVIHQM